jgi:hypothetical protein
MVRYYRDLIFGMANAAFLCKERKSAPVALRFGIKMTWKLLYEHLGIISTR